MVTDQGPQAETTVGKDDQPGSKCSSFVGTYPKVALSILIGAVGVSGLLNAVVFFTTLGIPYRLYLGATDFMAVAVRSSPSVLGTVIALFTVALALALVVWLVVEAGLRLLPKLLSWHWRLAPQRLARAEISAGRRLKCRPARKHHAPEERAVLATRLSERQNRALLRMEGRPQRFRHLLALLVAKRAWSKCCGLRACLRSIASLDFANRHYRPVFAIATVFVWAVGGFANQLCADRVHDRLSAARAAAGEDGQPACVVIERMRDREADDSAAGRFGAWALALFDYFYVDGYLRCASLKLADLDAGVGGLVLLGSTTSHSFFYKIDEGFPFTVPTKSIQSVAQMGDLPGILRNPKRPPTPDAARLLARTQATLTDVLELHTTIADQVCRLARPTLVVLPSQATARAPVDRCVRIEDVEFRFDLASADYDAEQHAGALERLRAYFESAEGQLGAGDYVLVVGHADLIGDGNFNQRLSERRAEAVRERLARESLNGVASKAHAIGLGEGASAQDGDPSGPDNRRVVIHHCRPDASRPTDAEVVERPGHGGGDDPAQAGSMNSAVDNAAAPWPGSTAIAHAVH